MFDDTQRRDESEMRTEKSNDNTQKDESNDEDERCNVSGKIARARVKTSFYIPSYPRGRGRRRQ